MGHAKAGAIVFIIVVIVIVFAIWGWGIGYRLDKMSHMSRDHSIQSESPAGVGTFNG